MEQERNYGYTAILCVCAAASALLLGKMAFYEPAAVHRPHAPVENAVLGEAHPVEAYGQISLSGAELTTLLRAALPEGTPIGGIRLQPHADGTVEATGDLETEKLRVDEIPRTLLLLMPSRCALRAVLGAGCDRATGELLLTVQSLEAGGFTLPQAFSDFLSGQLSTAANQALKERGIRFSNVRISEDQIAFSL